MAKLIGCLCALLVVISIIWPSKLLMSSNRVSALLLPNTRVCFNSLSSSFQSECVYCNKFLYSQTLQYCTGQMTLPSNVTQDQAFCIATTCLQQTWKSPTVLGRRRRRRAINFERPKPMTRPTLGSRNRIDLGLPNGKSLFSLSWNHANRSLQWRLGSDYITAASMGSRGNQASLIPTNIKQPTTTTSVVATPGTPPAPATTAQPSPAKP